MATGIPAGDRPLMLEGASLMKGLVWKNQVMLGSVNASYYYEMAVADLKASFQKWPGAIKPMITEKLPFEQFDEALHNHSADEIKVVVHWSEA